MPEFLSGQGIERDRVCRKEREHSLVGCNNLASLALSKSDVETIRNSDSLLGGAKGEGFRRIGFRKHPLDGD